MRTASKFARFAGMVALCFASLCSMGADSEHGQRKVKKPQLPPLPSGPTGPVLQIPLESIAPVPPQVSYQNGQLTIVAFNSTLGDILQAVREQTGAEIEIPAATERVVTHLGPGTAREVIAELLNGSRFNFMLLGSAQDPSLLTRVVLKAKTSPDGASPNPAGPKPGIVRAGTMAPPPQPVRRPAPVNDRVFHDDSPTVYEDPEQSVDSPNQQQLDGPPPNSSPDR
jgi:hypothetical protein